LQRSTPTLNDLTPWGSGLLRPEGVAVARDGRVYASDANAAVSEILADGSLRPIGTAGGEPNGINLTADGDAMVIANFAAHSLQQLDLASGEVTTLCDEVEGRPLRFANYPIVARDGTIYCTSSTQGGEFLPVLVSGVADGYIFRLAPGGTVDVVARDIPFANGLALDADEAFLYCVRTSPGDVVRFPVLADGRLGAEEPYGPPMGTRDVYGEEAATLLWGEGERNEFTADWGVLTAWGCTDGCAFDAAGNLWVTVPAAGRITAITPEQQLVTVAEDPTVLLAPTNVSFGGSDGCDVYVGSLFAPYVVKARSSVPGLLLAGQR
jgi:gluconolactonase